jgi:hypothetical protein
MSKLSSEVLHDRGLTPESKINIIIGVFIIVVGILSLSLSWAIWRLTYRGRSSLEVSGSKLYISFSIWIFGINWFWFSPWCFETRLKVGLTRLIDLFIDLRPIERDNPVRQD